MKREKGNLPAYCLQYAKACFTQGRKKSSLLHSSLRSGWSAAQQFPECCVLRVVKHATSDPHQILQQSMLQQARIERLGSTSNWAHLDLTKHTFRLILMLSERLLRCKRVMWLRGRGILDESDPSTTMHAGKPTQLRRERRASRAICRLRIIFIANKISVLSIYPSMHPSIHASIHPFIYPIFFYLSISLSNLSLYLSNLIYHMLIDKQSCSNARKLLYCMVVKQEAGSTESSKHPGISRCYRS